MARKRIGDMLIDAGLIDQHQLQSALAHQRQWGGKLGTILVEQGFLDEIMLYKGLAHQLGLPVTSISAHAVDRAALALLKVDFCEKNSFFPFKKDDRELTVATCNPAALEAVDEIAFATGLRVKVVLSPEREISWAIRHYYHGDPAPCPAPKRKIKLASENLEIEYGTSGGHARYEDKD